MSKLVFTNGKAVKGINPFDLDSRPGAWTVWGETETIKEDDARIVPTLYAALDIRYKSAADMPFCIYGKGDAEIDNTDTWQNKIGFLPNPAAFFGLAELSLAVFGRGYFYKGNNKFKVTKSLTYWHPDTVKPYFNTDGTVQKFERKENGKPKDYAPEEVLYFWLPDEGVEVGPPRFSPFTSALVPATALQSINLFIRDYMMRGAVKAMILALDGNPPPEEQKRVENWFNQFMRGARNMMWKAFNLSAVKPTIIGEGLEAIKDINIKTDLKADILEAMGVPASLLAASWATREGNARKEDGRFLISNYIVPDMKIVQHAMNDQILKAVDYRLQIEPNRLAVFQADDSERINALSNLLDALSKDVPPQKLKVAIEISGLVVTDEQMAELIKEDEKEEEPPQEDSADETTDDTMAEDLKKWQRKALKKIGKAVPFESAIIPPETNATIYTSLPNCQNETDVRMLFGKYIQAPAPKYDSEILALASALNKAAEALSAKPTE